MNEATVRAAAQAIAGAEAMLVTAGAGMGVDSGLPDFRGNEGFWRAYPPFAKLGLSFVDLANPSWFDEDPPLAWGFYGHRLHLYRTTTPHHGFHLLRQWAAQMTHGAFVFTSNVDGQFQRAGFPPDAIVECHGSLHHLQCAAPCANAIWSADGIEVTVDEATFRAVPPLPRCLECGDLARPNVLMFGDGGWLSSRTREQECRFQTWLDAARGSRLVIVELGAGTHVPTVRYTGEQLARELSATLVRINPREAHGPPATLSLAAGARAGIAAIDAALADRR